MDLSGFTTPKPERGTPARGTHVSSGQATPAQGSTATPAVPLCGTEARIAKQAQRREAREAERRAKRALLSTPPAIPAQHFLNERFDYPEFNKLMNVLCNTQVL